MLKIIAALYIAILCTTVSAATSYADYKSSPCISVMQAAETTMSNRQKGYSFKDMLLNSTKLSKVLSEKTGMESSDSQLLTYRMASSAMEEPVHDTDFYKSVAVSKFSSEYNTICEMKNLGL